MVRIIIYTYAVLEYVPLFITILHYVYSIVHINIFVKNIQCNKQFESLLRRQLLALPLPSGLCI